ncbi:hypothetical protein [Vallitalea okinawensis]|uniref:hypothetical protein n=1 Tax=Vallitalea okinawensis TaxID=2078660 RepID=UPI001300525F|nr:hypothetical protein [Vallitalea okinawensis]
MNTTLKALVWVVLIFIVVLFIYFLWPATTNLNDTENTFSSISNFFSLFNVI